MVLRTLLLLSSIRESFSWLASPHGQCHRHDLTKSLLRSSYDEMEIQDFDDEDIFDDAEEVSNEELESRLGGWDERVARLNTIHLVGRVGNAPEPRYFDDGKIVLNLSLACRRKYHYAERGALGIRSGEEETDWYGLGKDLAKYLGPLHP